MANELNPRYGHVPLVLHVEPAKDGMRSDVDTRANRMIKPDLTHFCKPRLLDRANAHHLQALQMAEALRTPRRSMHKEARAPHKMLRTPYPRGNTTCPWRAVRRLVKCIQPIDQQHSLQTYRRGPIEPCERIQIEWVRYGRPVDTVHVCMPFWILRDIRSCEDG